MIYQIQKIVSFFIFFSILVCSKLWAAPPVIHLQKGDKSVDLFATIHVSKPEFADALSAALANLSTADALAVEIDITDGTKLPAIAKSMMRHASLADNNLSQVLGEQRVQAIDALLGEATSLQDIQHFRPWWIAIIMVLKQAEKLGYDNQAIDTLLIQHAKVNNIPVLSLETPDEQLAVFGALSLAEELALLDESLSEHAKTELQQTVAIWQHHDEKLAKQLLQQLQQRNSKLYQRIYQDRNIAMADKIVTVNQDKPHLFVGVGALHLYGEFSLIRLLQQKGYKIISPE